MTSSTSHFLVSLTPTSANTGPKKTEAGRLHETKENQETSRHFAICCYLLSCSAAGRLFPSWGWRYNTFPLVAPKHCWHQNEAGWKYSRNTWLDHMALLWHRRPRNDQGSFGPRTLGPEGPTSSYHDSSKHSGCWVPVLSTRHWPRASQHRRLP